MSWTRQLETKAALEAQDWNKRGGILGKDTSKPISYKTVQKNKKLGEFVAEENIKPDADEQLPID